MNNLMVRTGIHLPETLKFVESEERYSVYRSRDGEEVYLAHGTAKRLVPLDEVDLDDLWHEFLQTSYAWEHAEFLKVLLGLVIEDEDEIQEQVGHCTDCHKPDWAEDQNSTSGDGSVCDSCFESYSMCDDCDEFARFTATTLSDLSVCDSCREAGWSWCDDCDGYYRDAYASDHEHDDDSCSCESPLEARAFTIRNDGEPPLANDTRVTVTLPAGVISDEGIGEIASYLRQRSWETDGEEHNNLHALSYRLSDLGEMWQTKDGNYTKRLSRYAYKEFGLKLAPQVVSRVGCIARDHSTAIDFQIETTRNLNLSAEEFAHEESCWWQSYTSSRCALKSNGGFGLRTFSGYYVTGRAWVMPLRQLKDKSLTPTFETQKPDAFVVFNGYGDLGGYTAARLMSHMAGMTYRKIGFTCSPMYVNSDSGYLVAPEEIASRYTDGSLYLSVNYHADLFHTERTLTNA